MAFKGSERKMKGSVKGTFFRPMNLLAKKKLLFQEVIEARDIPSKMHEAEKD
jgi:hypothetical protein